MTSRCLLIEIRLLDGRYHGQVDWPPSPFRVFQALVAGAYSGRWTAEAEAQRVRKDTAFEWLEGCNAPVIASPHARKARGVEVYVPNNDLDSVGGDPANMAKIRGSRKLFAPHIFDRDVPILYAWPFEDVDRHAVSMCEFAERLHTLGYGIDAAFARAEILPWSDAEMRLLAHGGPIAHPGAAVSGRIQLQCPLPGSLKSLRTRHRSGVTRFQYRDEGSSSSLAFRKAPASLSREVAYEQSSTHLLFDLRRADGTFHVLGIERALELAIAVRDRALLRLRNAFRDKSAEIERSIKGSRESTDADKLQRLRFLPLASIGHAHADMGLRRIAVELPPQCPLRSDDVAWALSGENLSVDRETGEIVNDLPTLVHAEDRGMLEHYGIGEFSTRRWRTITPMALPSGRQMARAGGERLADEQNAVAAVRQALRHAGHSAGGVGIRIQREPFRANGARAEVFAFNRFDARRLVHVELTFDAPKTGSLVLGDGRFLGLGLFSPDREPASMHAFAISEAHASNVPTLTRALRRAVMARVRDTLGLRDWQGLPLFFCGHERDGSPSRVEQHAHLYFVLAPRPVPSLLVIAPHVVHRRTPVNDERQHLWTLDEALVGLRELRVDAGAPLRLATAPRPEPSGSLLGPSYVWVSATDYRSTRHPRSRDDARTWLINDVGTECERRGLPHPAVHIESITAGPRGGLEARLRLTFSVAVSGPILLGRNAHFGLGLFVPTRDA